MTQIKLTQAINAKESDLGISEEASWHSRFKNSAYIYAGGLAFDLTEGDLLAVFAQYGEVVDVNLIRDKGTGKSKGYAFLAYEDQRSTILAVDNLNGAQVLGRTIMVSHRGEYKKHEEEDEEMRQRNREARGVCRAFQRGECTRGDSCKFSHDEKRAANTGWGHEEDRSAKWDHDKFNGAKKGGGQRGDFKPDAEEKTYREKGHGERERVEREPRSRDSYDRREQKRSGRLDDTQYRRHDAENDYAREDKRSRTHDSEKSKERSRRDCNDREGDGSSRQSDSSSRKDSDYSSRDGRRR